MPLNFFDTDASFIFPLDFSVKTFFVNFPHKMNNIASKSKHFMLLGQCLPSLKKNASKIRVRRMELDKNLNMVKF